jgi:hypothetical protein
MLLSILYWYLIVSYIVGVVIYFAELPHSLQEKDGLVIFSTILVLLSPLIAWHGALHYIQRWFCQLTGKPIKYWI